jgi:uncharacterized protein (TIGR02271 family)
VQLAEERLAAGKTQVANGGLDVHKRVETEHIRQEIPLRREEVTVERRPLTGAEAQIHATGLTGHAIEAHDDHIRVPLMREEVIAQKIAVPTEEVIIRKTQHIDTKPIEADLRREHLETERIATTASATHTGFTDSRDLNRDGHVSMGERAAAATTGAHNTGFTDSRDLNRDGHVSMGERAAAATTGAHSTGLNTGLADSRDLNRDGHVSLGEKAKAATHTGPAGTTAYGDSRDLNHDGHVSAGEKAAAAGTGAGFAHTKTDVHGDDPRDENHDGHVSLKEKIKDKLHIHRHHDKATTPP